MPRALQVVPPLPNLHTALERFLARSRFAARTRESHAQDLAPLVAKRGEEPITSADGYARLSYRQLDTLWKKYTPAWDLHQLRHTAISARAAHGYSDVELKRFNGHLSLRSLEIYIAHNREAAKRKARMWERRDSAGT